MSSVLSHQVRVVCYTPVAYAKNEENAPGYDLLVKVCISLSTIVTLEGFDTCINYQC